MKTSDGYDVPSRAWYYLLDCKDKDFNRFVELTGKTSVHTLTREEFWKMLHYYFHMDVKQYMS